MTIRSRLDRLERGSPNGRGPRPVEEMDDAELEALVRVGAGLPPDAPLTDDVLRAAAGRDAGRGRSGDED